ncbi:MAG: DUF3365 domain-containing protein [Spirochaetales bacterium]|nr:DUF3365 domain-containing protein [Spirochaetales bacterium]
MDLSKYPLGIFFLILFVAVYILLSALVLVNLRNLLWQYAEDEASEKAEIILNKNLAVHRYFTEQLKPNLLSRLPESDYDPIWMSSTHAITVMNQYMREDNQFNYYFKDAAIDARSINNEADERERSYLLKLNQEKSLAPEHGIYKINNVPYYFRLQAGERLETQCMECHSLPEKAPKGLTSIYGNQRSFNRVVGDYVSVVSIRIPMVSMLKKAESYTTMMSFLLFAGFIFAVFLFAYAYIKVFYRPLKSLSSEALRIAKDQSYLGAIVSIKVGREMSDFSNAFSKMSLRLKNYTKELESEVYKRTEAFMESERQYRLLFSTLSSGFALHEIILDDTGQAVDYRFLEVNNAFEKMTGLVKSEIIGKTLLEVVPETEKSWIRTYGKVAISGEPAFFENFAISLNRHYEVLAYSPQHGQFATIINDITDRKKYIAQLQEARSEAEKAANIKTDFLANISHEIRNPLHGIIGMVDLLKPTASNLEQREYLEMLEKSAKMLQHIVNDVLDIAKIESGKRKFKKDQINLTNLFTLLQQDINHELTKKKLDFFTYIDPGLPEILVQDEITIKQIIGNLLSNAAKFCDKGEVFLGAYFAGQEADHLMVKFLVKDTGIGIDKTQLEQIFERFSQLESTYTKRFAGTGLGLNIVKSLVDMLEGSIEVQSEVNKGSTFTVLLSFENQSQLETEDHVHVESPLAEKNKGRLRILFAEDDLVNQIYVSKLLSDAGYDVMSVKNGNEVMAALKNNSFDVFLLDIQMPGKSGLECIQEIRNNLKISSPAIALSGFGMEEDVRVFLESGFDHVLTKPVTKYLLLKKISEISLSMA